LNEINMDVKGSTVYPIFGRVEIVGGKIVRSDHVAAADLESRRLRLGDRLELKTVIRIGEVVRLEILYEKKCILVWLPGGEYSWGGVARGWHNARPYIELKHNMAAYWYENDAQDKISDALTNREDDNPVPDAVRVALRCWDEIREN
jgi:hypothetical protein